MHKAAQNNNKKIVRQQNNYFQPKNGLECFIHTVIMLNCRIERTFLNLEFNDLYVYFIFYSFDWDIEGLVYSYKLDDDSRIQANYKYLIHYK